MRTNSALFRLKCCLLSSHAAFLSLENKSTLFLLLFVLYVLCVFFRFVSFPLFVLFFSLLLFSFYYFSFFRCHGCPCSFSVYLLSFIGYFASGFLLSVLLRFCFRVCSLCVVFFVPLCLLDNKTRKNAFVCS